MGSSSEVPKKNVAKRSIGVYQIEMTQLDVTLCKLGDVERLYDARLCEVLVLLYTHKLASR